MPFSSLSIKLTCTGCGLQTAKLLDWLREHADRVDCADCGLTIVIDQEQVGAELATLADAVDELAKKIRELQARLANSSPVPRI